MQFDLWHSTQPCPITTERVDRVPLMFGTTCPWGLSHNADLLWLPNSCYIKGTPCLLWNMKSHKHLTWSIFLIPMYLYESNGSTVCCAPCIFSRGTDTLTDMTRLVKLAEFYKFKVGVKWNKSQGAFSQKTGNTELCPRGLLRLLPSPSLVDVGLPLICDCLTVNI